ncbi:hypothetical protein F7725_017775 [Dissostichus mawsoni]|uniref:C2 domain-containing protein n=1 Tax=Dissostichus mawsoni TaxID=36200 RepID=A0A7J5XSI8_DISMA|nr:hypothetical protein F7725_017775 [Dissostichus mawsoni]
MTILPEKKHRVKTRVLRKTLDPLFDETFTFYGVTFSALPDLTLHFLVLSFDRFARDDVIVRLGAAEGRGPEHRPGPPEPEHQQEEHAVGQASTGAQGPHVGQNHNIQGPHCESRGELLASLSYQPVSHRLSVVVLKARHLPKMDITGLSANPYVKVNVFYGRKRIAKKKTHVKKCTLNPVFNESFIYDIPPELLPEVSVEFLVVDFDRTTKNEVLGRLLLGLNSPETSGAKHWAEVCQNPRRQISKWHNLSEKRLGSDGGTRIRLESDGGTLIRLGSDSDQTRIRLGSDGGTRIRLGSDSDQTEGLGSDSDQTRIRLGSDGGTRIRLGSDSDQIRIRLGSDSDQTEDSDQTRIRLRTPYILPVEMFPLFCSFLSSHHHFLCSQCFITQRFDLVSLQL